jgi:hypothetical protein
MTKEEQEELNRKIARETWDSWIEDLVYKEEDEEQNPDNEDCNGIED